MLFFAEGSGLPGSLTLVVLGILAAIIGALLVGTQSYYTRNKSSAVTFEPLARRESAEPPHGANAPQTAPWEIGTYETARELSAELDSKMNTLVHLIEEADRSAARLEAALAAAGRKAGSAAGPTHERSPDTLATDPRAHATLAGQAEGLLSASAGERAAPNTGNQPSGPAPAAPRRCEEIYTLADDGYAAAEIAHRSGVPVGEVQLILSLRSAQREAGDGS